MKKQTEKKKLPYKVRHSLHLKKKPKIYFVRLQPRAIVVFTTNNMFFNICGRLREDPYLYTNFYWVSCGALKFSPLQYKGATKLTFLANYAFGQFLHLRIKKLKFHGPTKLCFKGSGRYFSAFVKGFKTEGTKVRTKIKIMDITNVALNGCRLPSKRRT